MDTEARWFGFTNGLSTHGPRSCGTFVGLRLQSRNTHDFYQSIVFAHGENDT